MIFYFVLQKEISYNICELVKKLLINIMIKKYIKLKLISQLSCWTNVHVYFDWFSSAEFVQDKRSLLSTEIPVTDVVFVKKNSHWNPYNTNDGCKSIGFLNTHPNRIAFTLVRLSIWWYFGAESAQNSKLWTAVDKRRGNVVIRICASRLDYISRRNTLR